MQTPILTMKDIEKSFPGVKALSGVSLEIFEGKVLALLGENGAGKSTLMKILSGVYEKECGQIIYNGQDLNIKNPKEAQEQGIVIIHQELNLIPDLSIGENIFLGKEPTGKLGNIDWKKLHGDSERLLAKLGLNRSTKTLIKSLSIADQQLVEIAKALSMEAKVIIMDEPTDALSDHEVKKLFEIVMELKKSGKAIVFISHRLEEIFEICDDVTVLRDGKAVGSAKVSDIDQDKLIEMMVGRKLTDQFPYLVCEQNEKVLEVEGISNPHIQDISFDLSSGEILGISGLVGAGRTELAKTLYGVYKVDSGTIKVSGKPVTMKDPHVALENGVVYISEDRKGEGLVLGLSVLENMTLSSLDRFSGRFLNINKSKELDVVKEYIKKMSIKTPSGHQIIKNLSGGNQQKVSIAKGLLRDPKVLILDEPTRGVDVGAKKEIYEIINALKNSGLAILVISSEMPELLGVCDRIMVMHEGKLKGILNRDEATQEKIMSFALCE